MDTPAPDPKAQREHRVLVIAATTCAIAVLASQLAGKAARDAIFLQRFAVTNLPLLLAASSALAIFTTFLFARYLRRGIPVRVVQMANLVSASLLIVEWILLPHFGGTMATIVFMHQTLIGPILVSGFWSVITECFDPRTARRVLGTVGTGATIGAVLGAVLAERVAAMIGTNALLPTIAILQLVAMQRIGRIGRGCPMPEGEEPNLLREATHNITRVSLLRNLALVTVIVTVAAALLDYVFKAGAQASVKKPDDLARLFALFHGVVGILTAIVQWVFGRWALQKLGLARTLATLPGMVIAFGISAIIAPGMGTYVALRGAENVIRNSLYREAYEVFYTPLLAAERRATKTIIDVGVERFGDVIGGLSVLAILAIVHPATTALLVGAVVLSAVGVIVALQAQQAYVEALERSLLAKSIELDEPRDRTTLRTIEAVTSRSRATPMEMPGKTGRWRFRRKDERGALDPSLERLRELVSNDPARIRHALDAALLSPAGVAYAISLLDRPAVSDHAARALGKVAGPCIGQLVDAVRDSYLPVAIRARVCDLVPIAADSRSRAELARVGLSPCLADPELDVRIHVAEALTHLQHRYPDIVHDETTVFEGVRRELAIESPEADQIISHLATLLALVLPAEPIRAALHGLNSDDPALRGVALEYLENVLPDDVRDRMWGALAIEAPTTATKRSIEDILDELLHSKTDMRATQIDLPAARA